MLRKLLFRMAKSPWAGRLVGKVFQYASRAVPVKGILRSKEVFAFCHPQPAYENHIILSPKKPIRNLQQMSAMDQHGYLAKIWAAAMEIRAQQANVYDSFTLAANGGKRQEVQQVHFHMFTNHPMVNEYADELKIIFYQNEEICIFEPIHPEWDIHFVLKPAASATGAYFRSVLRSIDLLNEKLSIVEKGYSLVYQHNPSKNSEQYPVFHIVSGKKCA